MSGRNQATTLQKVLFFFSSFPKIQLTFIVGLTVLQGLVEVFTVGILVPFVAVLADPVSAVNQRYIKLFHEFLGAPDIRDFIAYFGILILGIALSKTLFSIFIRRTFLVFTFETQNILSNRLFLSYLARDYEFFTATDSSLLLRNVNSITGSLVNGLLMPSLVLLSDGIVLLVLISLLFYVNPLLTFLLALILGSILLGAHLFLRRKLNKMGAERNLAVGQMYQILSESFQGVKDVKILGKEKYFLNLFREVSQKLSRIEANFSTITAFPALLNEFLGIATVVAAVLALLFRGVDIAAIIPATSFYLLAGYRLIPAVSRISPSLHSIGFYSNAMDLIHYELSTMTSSTSMSTDRVGAEKMPLHEKIEMKGIEFTYAGSPRPVLAGVNLELKKNTSTALVGSSGAGKTTIVDLLMGLYVADRGAIKIDGVDLNLTNAPNWRRSIGYIPQSIYLCDRSVEENIAFGVPPAEIDREAVKKAATLSQLDEVISALPEGFQTKIGERGVRLSGGQRQRIGIARALYGDPELIIMDEATSAMDNLTESEIVNQISQLSRTKTLLIIAHRLTTIRHCDRIYVMHKGKVESSGKYDELLKSSDFFARLSAIGQT